MNRRSQRLGELAVLIGGTLEGDPDITINAVAPIDEAGDGDLSFVANTKYVNKIGKTGASALILEPGVDSCGRPAIRHPHPYLATAMAIDLIYPEESLVDAGVDLTAVIEPGADIDPTSGIGPLCNVRNGSRIGRNCQLVSSVFIGRNVILGDDCSLYPGVRVMDGCKLGNNVILHSGAVIGSDGFGFAPTPTGMKKVRQVGWVEIADDVEIGANSTVDRGALGPTRIGRGTKIDNLVQIAHNVQIGENCVIVAQAGISGSTKLGDRVTLAGQVGLVGHIEIGTGSTIAAQSGVTKSFPEGTVLLGSPALEIGLARRVEASLRRLPELLKRVHKIETES